MVVKRLNVQLAVHLICDVIDSPLHLAFAVDNPTTPEPFYENTKDKLDLVQFGGVRRQVDVVVVAEVVSGVARLVDPGVVHHKGDFAVPDFWAVVGKRMDRVNHGVPNQK